MMSTKGYNLLIKEYVVFIFFHQIDFYRTQIFNCLSTVDGLQNSNQTGTHFSSKY